MYYMFPVRGPDHGGVPALQSRRQGRSGPPCLAAAQLSCGPMRDRCSARRWRPTFPIKTVRYKVIDGFCALWRFKLENLVRSDNTVATDQIIHYPPVSDDSRYTFSLWAFPEEIYPTRAAAIFRVLQEVLPRQGLSQQHAVRRLPDPEGPAVSALLFVGRQRDDHRSGVHRESRAGRNSCRPTTSSAATTAAFRCSTRLRMVTRAQIGEGLGRPLEAVCRGAQDLRPQQPAAERLFPRPVGRSVTRERELRHAIHTVGTAQE